MAKKDPAGGLDPVTAQLLEDAGELVIAGRLVKKDDKASAPAPAETGEGDE